MELEQEVSGTRTGSQKKTEQEVNGNRNRSSLSEEELCPAPLPVVLFSKLQLLLHCWLRPLHQRVRWGRGPGKPCFLQPFVPLLVVAGQFPGGPGVVEPVLGRRPLDGVLDVVEPLAGGGGSSLTVVEGVVALK